jgi:opacity protein-like surface antigen
MKNHSIVRAGLILITSIALLSTTTGKCGPGWEPRGFFWLDAGVTFLDAEMQATLPEISPIHHGGTINFDPEFGTGFWFGLGGGFEFNRWVALDLPIGFAYNSVDSVTTTSTQGSVFANTSGTDGSFYQLSFVPRLILKYPIEFKNGGKLVPMVGIGGGATLGLLDLNNWAMGYRNSSVFGIWDVNDTDAAFTWEILAGIRYDFNETTSLGLRYTYRGINDLSFTGDLSFPNQSDFTSEVGFQDMTMQTVSLVITWTF